MTDAQTEARAIALKVATSGKTGRVHQIQYDTAYAAALLALAAKEAELAKRDVASFDAATAHGKTKVERNKAERLAEQRACEISNLQSVIDLVESEKAAAIQRAKRAEAQLAEKNKALEPFVRMAAAVFYINTDGREMNASKPDDAAVWGFDLAMLTYGDLRRAREQGGQ